MRRLIYLLLYYLLWFHLYYICIACDTCRDGKFDFNQCFSKDNSWCIDIIDPLKNDGPENILSNEERKSFKLVVSKNVFSENLLQLKSVNSTVLITTNWQNSTINIMRESGLMMLIDLVHINLNPVFEDVTHSGDNDIVLKSTEGSNMYHWKKPLIKILTNHCRYPIPKYYYLTANEYRNRYTRATKIICANQKYPHSQFYCPPEYFDGQLYYFRTVNDRCNSNKASKLIFEKNSFHCTQNTELVHKIFDYNIREKLSTSGKSMCDIHNRKCEACLKNIEKSCQSDQKFSGACCATKCHQNMNCLAFYTTDCYDSIYQRDSRAHNICMKGDTIKFTLTPKFDFENSSFLCHIKRKKMEGPSLIMILHLQLFHQDQLLWNSDSISHSIIINEIKGQKTVGEININWKVNIYVENEMYLQGMQKNKKDYFTYKLLKMKNPKDFLMKSLKLNKRKDTRHLEVQNGRPFHFSTENWYNFSCRLKATDIFPPQDIYKSDFQNINIASIHKSSEHGSKSSFVYTMESAENPSEISIELLNKSIIPSFLCNKQSGKFLIPASEPKSDFIQLKSVQWPNKWNVYFEGSVSKIPTYINVKIIDIHSQSVLFYEDQIIHKSYFDTENYILSQLNIFHQKQFLFYNNFSFERKLKPTNKQKGFGIRIEIKDCFQKHSYKLFLFEKKLQKSQFWNESQFFIHNKNMSFFNIASKITILTLSFGSIYITLIFLYFLTKIYKYFKINSHSNGNGTIIPQKSKRHNSDVTYKKKFFMLFYVTFRVFYTFLFTLSVGFSLFLGIDSQNGQIYTTQNRFFNWIRQESKQINQFTISELKRHLQYSSNLKKACENQDEYKIKRLESEMIISLNNSLQRWYSIPSKSVLNETIDFFNKTIEKYQEKLQQISDKLQFNIRSRFHDRYGQYQQMLKQYYNLKYFTVIQIVHNHSNPFIEDIKTSKNNGSFIQQILIDFFNFLSIYETTSLNSDATHNLNRLKMNFYSFIKTKSKWSKDFNLNHPSLKMSENLRTIYRMFDSKDQKFQKDNLELNDIYHQTFEKKSFKTLISFKIMQTRMFLVVIDCFIVIYRFYSTFEVLKWMWLGKKILVYSAIPREIKSKSFLDKNYNNNDGSGIDHSRRDNYQISPLNNISLRLITHNQYPDWSPINPHEPFFNSCFKSRKYLNYVGRIHFVTVLIMIAVILILMAVMVIANYIYLKHYNPNTFKQNMIILERMQPLINARLKHIADYVNFNILKNAKIHNINMSSLVINSSYLLSHIQKNVCQQLTWEMNSIKERSNTHSVSPFDICRLQSDVNFLPYLLVHISPCQFLDVLPINYTLSAIFYDKNIQRSSSIRKTHQIIFMIICIIITIATAIGSIHIFCNIILKAVLKYSKNCRYVMLTPFYPHCASVKIHSSSSHSTQSGRNIPNIEANCLMKSPLPTVTGGHFNEYPTSLLHFQLTATSESDV